MMTYAFNWVKTGASVVVGYDKVQPDNVDIVPYFGAAMRAWLQKMTFGWMLQIHFANSSQEIAIAALRGKLGKS
jgi:hypothetical protein